MNIYLWDHRPNASAHISTLKAAEVRDVCGDLKYHEVDSLSDADIVLAHFDDARLRAIAGVPSFRKSDITNWNEVVRRLATWRGVFDSGRLASFQLYTSGTGGVAGNLNRLVADELNSLLGRSDLKAKLVDHLPPLESDAHYLADLADLGLNELYSLNRMLLDSVLSGYVKPVDSDLKVFPEKQIVIFVTTQKGYPDRFPYEHSMYRLGGRIRYLLFAKDMSILIGSEGHVRKEELKQLLSLDADRAERIIRHSASPANLSVSRFFYAEQPDLLQALMILCIGFLSATVKPNEDVSSQRNESLRVAIEKIGLHRFWAEADGSGSSWLDRLGTEARTVKAREWWLKGFGVLDHSNNVREDLWKRFANDLEQQWKEADGASLPKALCQMLNELHDHSEITEKSVVSAAFLDLAERLRVPSWQQPVH